MHQSFAATTRGLNRESPPMRLDRIKKAQGATPSIRKMLRRCAPAPFRAKIGQGLSGSANAAAHE